MKDMANTMEFGQFVYTKRSLKKLLPYPPYRITERVERKDTDILTIHWRLKVTESKNIEMYGYDRDGNRIQVRNQKSVYAIKTAIPIFGAHRWRFGNMQSIRPWINVLPQEGDWNLPRGFRWKQRCKDRPRNRMAHTTEVGPEGKQHERDSRSGQSTYPKR